MANKKEKCFEKSLEKLEKATGKDLKVEHRPVWTKGPDQRWYQGKVAALRERFKNVFNTKEKLQRRYPDLTIDKKQVADTKFTGDRWRDTPSRVSDRTQKADQAEINKQMNGKDEAISIDPNSCECKKRLKAGEVVPQVVYKKLPVFNNNFNFVPMPSAVPALPGVPSLVPGPSLIPVFP